MNPHTTTNRLKDERTGGRFIRSSHGVIAGIALSTALMLSSCGSSGGSSDSGSTTIKLTGVISYDRVPVSAQKGLDYANTVKKPARGVTVQLRGAGGQTVVASTVADAQGKYQFTVNKGLGSLSLVALAQLGPVDAPTVRAVDNTNKNAQYALNQAVIVGTEDQVLNVHAASGWTGTRYGQPRSAAPFAILDTVKDCYDFVKAADPLFAPKPLTVAWSTANSRVANDVGTFYNQGTITVEGQEDVYTGEYSEWVLSHEWGHYLTDNVGRDDSVGGSHAYGEVLDPTVAWSEGFANGWAHIVTNSPYNLQVEGPKQSSVSGWYLTDTSATAEIGGKPIGTVINFNGSADELGISALIYRLYTGSPKGPTALNFKVIYQALKSLEKSPAFTTIYGFMTAVKEAQPNSVTAIETAEADFNILAHDQYQELAPERRLYTDIPADGTWVDTDAAGALWSTSNTYGLLAGNKIDLSGELGNKLGNIRYGRSASNVPRVQVTLLPTNPQHLVGLQWLQASQSDPIIFPGSPATSGGFTEILGTTTPGPFTFRITSFPTTANPSGVTPFKVKIDTLPVPAPIVRSNG